MALDLGDQWIGSALSDASQLIARPYKTVTLSELEEFIAQVLVAESIELIIVGYPKTMSGKISEQTLKIQKLFEHLEQKFPATPFKLWDERLSSKRAEALSKSRTAEEKRKSHSIAAAFILDSYLTYVLYQRELLS